LIHTFFGFTLKLRTYAVIYILLSLGLARTGAGGVAHATHLGGMVIGMLYTRWVQTRSLKAYLQSWVPKRRAGPGIPAKRVTRGPLHRCAMCGATERDQPPREFRICSSCSGGQEYCQEHLANHPHQS
jgi:hypothetical protein